MSSGPTSPWTWARHERLTRIAPLPFVAVAAILVALLLFTPVLLSTGPSAYLAQGELTVDRLPSVNWTKFYVTALDPHAVRYSSIDLRVGSGFSWNGACPTGTLTWTSLADTQAMSLLANTTANPVVVNATAVYSSADGPVVYAGVFAFNVLDPTGPAPVLQMVACTSSTPGISVPSPSIDVASLPISLSLFNYGSGGPP